MTTPVDGRSDDEVPKEPSVDDGGLSSDSTGDKSNDEKGSPFLGIRPGRRGDPRMHKAVKARLANPNLSPLQALRLGGFDYPLGVTDAHVLENDTVSLGQHKNQLSRRCRLAREQAQNEMFKQQTVEGSLADRKAEADRFAAAGDLHNFAFSEIRERKRGMALRDDRMLMKKMDAQEQIRRESIARQRMITASHLYPPTNPFHAPHASRLPGIVPDQNLPIANLPTVPPPGAEFLASRMRGAPSAAAHDALAGNAPLRGLVAGRPTAVPSSFTRSPPLVDLTQATPYSSAAAAAAASAQSTAADPIHRPNPHPRSAGRLLVAPPRKTQQSLLEILDHTPQPSAPAASLRANNDALVVEQLATALSSTTSLADALAHLPLPDQKHDAALNLYRAESIKTYERCMLLAGFSVEEAQESSLAYRLFALMAWAEEGKRLGRDNALMERLLSG